MLRRYLLIVLLFWSHNLVGQENDSMTLAALVQVLHENYKVTFAYDASLILNEKERFTYPEKQQNLKKVLEAIFKDGKVTYLLVDDNKILLRKLKNAPAGRKIIGYIYDDLSKNPLPYASVYVPGTTNGAMTDAGGKYEITVARKDSLIVQYLGYESVSLPQNVFPKKMYLKVQSQQIDEVTIFIHPAIYQGNDYGNILLDADQFIKKSAIDVYGKDLIRSLQMLPGVGSDDDSGGKLRVRGSQADEVLIVLDGVPLYKVDHYYGIFGAINSDYVESIELYKNSIPFHYDGRTSGMLRLESNQDFSGVNGTIEADFLKLSSSLELPLNDNIALTIGGRINHTDPFKTPLSEQSETIDPENSFIDKQSLRRNAIADVKPEFKFHDLNTALRWKLGKNSSLLVSGITSSDQYSRNYENEFLVKLRNIVALNQEFFRDSETWKNQGIGVGYQKKINNNFELKGQYYYTSYENDHDYAVGAIFKTRRAEKEIFGYKSNNLNKIKTQGFSLRLNKNKDFEIGTNLLITDNTISFSENEKSNLLLNQSQYDISLFALKELNLMKNFIGSIGVKSNYLSSIENLSLSPVINLKWKLNPSLYLKGSYAHLYQNVRELQFETRLGSSLQYFVLPSSGELKYPQGISDNYMLGANYRKGDWRVDVEFYRKQLSGAIGYLPLQPGIGINNVIPNVESNYQVYAGIMKTKGIDVLLSYDGYKLFSQLAYTWSKTENTFEEIFLGHTFPSQYDRRHQLKWANSYKWGKFKTGINFVYNSGSPYTSFNLLKNNIDRRNINIEDAIRTLPAYYRVDVNLEYVFKHNKVSPYIRASIYNLTNRINIKNIQQTFSVPLDSDREDDNVILGFQSPLVERLYNLAVGIQF